VGVFLTNVEGVGHGRVYYVYEKCTPNYICR
jgi:hypothetical protein